MDKRLTEFARRNRKNPTRAEAMLWAQLRGRGLGYRFRRQQPIGPFIVDFVCFERKLILELDGWTHHLLQSRGYDDTRQRWLEAEDYVLLRFADEDVWEDIDAVCASILLALDSLGGCML